MRARLAVVAVAMAIAGCGGEATPPNDTENTGGTGNTGGSGPSSTGNQVTVSSNQFDPATTTVAVGTTVTWTWAPSNGDGYGGSGPVLHSVTWQSGFQGSGNKETGTYQRTFSAAGSYAYQCSVHGSAMSGTVTVQ